MKRLLVLILVLIFIAPGCKLLVRDESHKVRYGMTEEPEPVMYEYNGNVGRMYSVLVFDMKGHAVQVNIKKDGTDEWFSIDIVEETDVNRRDPYSVGIVRLDKVFFKNLKQEDRYRIYVFLQ